MSLVPSVVSVFEWLLVVICNADTEITEGWRCAPGRSVVYLDTVCSLAFIHKCSLQKRDFKHLVLVMMLCTQWKPPSFKELLPPLAYVFLRRNCISFTEAVHAYILLTYAKQFLPFLRLKAWKLFALVLFLFSQLNSLSFDLLSSFSYTRYILWQFSVFSPF